MQSYLKVMFISEIFISFTLGGDWLKLLKAKAVHISQESLTCIEH